MKITMKMEDRTLRFLAYGCYAFALTACGVTTYTLVALSQAIYANLGQGLYLTASQF
ncbi:MAG TPA: hypothetical protein VD835_05820 [Pyrinomonadaceae bacterium]|nr:hypothetical protein [Pyrinomonadaceae bacterium]